MGLFGGSDSRINATFTATDKATPVVKTLRGNIKALGTKTGGPLGGLLGGLGSITPTTLVAGAGIGALAGIVADSISKFEEQQKIAAQTEAVLKSTGDAAGVTARDIGDLASAIEAKTGIDDEAIQKGENLLLTFTNIRNEAGKGNDIFNQTVQVMTDMSVAMGTDASSGAIQLGKALNDPVKGITALTRVGVAFTASQKTSIAEMVKSGHVLEAQKVILAELNKEFGGSAEAFGNTLPGAQAKLANAIDDLEKKLGEALAPAIKSSVDGVITLISQVGNLGTAFDNLHRFIDPAYAKMEDLRNTVLQEAQAYGYSADEIQAYIDMQVKAIQARAAAAAAAAAAKHDIQGVAAAEQAEADALSDSDTLRRNAIDAIQEDARQKAQNARYTQQLAAREAEQAKAAQEAADAMAEYHHRLDYLTPGLSHFVSTNAQVIANFKSDWRAAAINVPRTITNMGNSIHKALADIKSQDKQDLKNLIYDLNHPGQEKKLLEWLPKAMKKAQAALQRAEQSGDAAAIAEAAALVEKLNAQWAQLHGTITVNTAFHSNGGGGGRVRLRAGGGPVSSDRSYIVGENGPEMLHIGRGGSGFVTPGVSGAGRGQPHTTLVYLNGDLIAKQVDRWQGQHYAVAGHAQTRN